MTRGSQYTNSRRAYKIPMDGRHLAKIENGQTRVLAAPSGSHVLVAEIDWIKSAPLEVFVKEGETVSVLVYCRGLKVQNLPYLLILCGILTAFGAGVASLLGMGIGGGIAAIIFGLRTGRPRLSLASDTDQNLLTGLPSG